MFDHYTHIKIYALTHIVYTHSRHADILPMMFDVALQVITHEQTTPSTTTKKKRTFF